MKPGNVLKVDAFLNHQCDVRLFDHMGAAWAEHFNNKHITKILTIEASGIGIACVAATHFDDVPVVFAKKAQSINLDGEQYVTHVYSFTKQKEFPVIVSKKYLNAGDRVLLIDDFLANGKALNGSSNCANRRARSWRVLASPSRKDSKVVATPCVRPAMIWIHWPSWNRWMPRPGRSNSATDRTQHTGCSLLPVPQRIHAYRRRSRWYACIRFGIEEHREQ